MTRIARKKVLAVGFLLATLAAHAGPPLTLPPATPVTNLTFVAFDTETTGLDSTTARIVEIAAVKFRGSRVLDRQCWLINPGIPIPESARRIHGLSDAMVSNSPPFATVLPPFRDFTDGCVLLAHNAGFDRRFVAAELKRSDLAAPCAPLLDSLALFKAWFPGKRSFALESLASELLPGLTNGLPAPTQGERTNRFHTAGWDADCLMALFVKGSTNLPAGATLGDLLRLTGGAYAFGTARRQWRPAVGQSSSDAAPDELAP